MAGIERSREWGRRKCWFAIALATAGAYAATACSDRKSADDIDAFAREYVELGLTYGEIEADALDFYFGPEDMVPPADEGEPDREVIRADLEEMLARLAEAPRTARRDHLAGKAASLLAIMDASSPDENMPFAEQAQRLYGVNVAAPDEDGLQRARQQLEAMLPGPGSLVRRMDAYAANFVIGEDRRRAIFMRALDECRERTMNRWALPADNTLEVEWNGSVGAAWHTYLGDGHSVLQVNPAAVADIGSSLDVACHEAWPGHHAQFLVQRASSSFALEDKLVFTRSPEQLLREGAAQFGVDLAFPPAERAAFLRDELFPLAGLDPGEAQTFAQVHAARQALGAAAAPILADYLDRRITGFAAEQALAKEALVSSPAALLAFADRYGAYVLGYSVAREAVAACVAARADAAGEGEEGKWLALRAIVASSDLSALKGESC